MTNLPGRRRSKAVAAWLAIVGGGLGLHRFYLYGMGDLLAWLHPWPTLAGAYGFWRMRQLGVDDAVGARLVPLLGAMMAATMLMAIVYGLTNDARWQARHGGARADEAPPSPWPAIVAAVVALAVGATVTMATIAFTAQRYFETRV